MSKPHCGECSFFKYEDTDGYGLCDVTQREQRCSDHCVVHYKSMTPKACLRVLHEYQKWRRGGKGPMPHPYVIGLSIDKAITIIRNRMKEKTFTMEDLVSFGNYLLSEERNESIESPEMKGLVGDWDITNWQSRQ